MADWFYVLYEIFVGNTDDVAGNGDRVNQYVKIAFACMHIGTSPIVCRYRDWSTTGPLQLVVFYLLPSADDDAV